MNKKIVIGVREAVFFILLTLLYFQNWLIEVDPIFGFLDEGVSLFCLIYFLYSTINKGKIKKYIFSIFLIAFLIIVITICFNFFFKIQTNFIPIVEDLFSLFKFLFVYLGMSEYLTRNRINRTTVAKAFTPLLKFYLLVLFICSIFNLFIDINMDSGTRYGFRMFSFIYDTPGHIINQASYSLLILNAVGDSMKRNKIWIGITLFIMTMTLKTRAFILIVSYFSFIYVFKLKRKKNMVLESGIIASLIILVGYSQFEHYFLNNGTPRQMFVAGALKLVREYFPFGTGFATYGSSAASDYYSKLYYQLGFSTRWGLDPITKLFLNDNYLPMVFVQFGLILGCIYILLIYKIIKGFLNSIKNQQSPTLKVATYFFLSDIVLSSIQSSYLAHYSVVTLCIFYFIFFYNDVLEELG